jgi:hypothetical protein
MGINMGKRVIVYADESGNTGPNYLDDQEFYVLAGWIVPVEKCVDVALVVENFLKNYGSVKELPKIKMKKGGNREKAISLIRKLGSLGCVPLYVMAEKKYCLGAHVVEALLDSDSNDKVKSGFLSDFKTKQELANTFSEKLPRGILIKLADCYNEVNEEKFKEVHDEIIKATRREINSELASILEGSLPYKDEIARLEMNLSILGKCQHTPNLPALISFLMLVENLGRQGNISPEKFVHDQQAIYEVEYLDVFKIYKNSKDAVFSYPDHLDYYTYFNHIPRFETQDSASNHALQAADWLARSISYLCSCISSGKTFDKLDKELADIILTAILIPSPKLAWPVVSDKFWKLLRVTWGSVSLGVIPEDKIESLDRISDMVFPIAGEVSNSPEGVKIRGVSFPYYILLGKKDRAPLILDLDSEDEFLKGKSAFPLFSSREIAENFCHKNLVSDEETWEVMAFDLNRNDFLMFLALLDSASENTELITFNPDDHPLEVSDLARFYSGLKQMVSRVMSMLIGGFESEFLQMHKISGQEVMTFFSYDGNYIAAISFEGKIYKGRTREEALEACKIGEGL